MKCDFKNCKEFADYGMKVLSRAYNFCQEHHQRARALSRKFDRELLDLMDKTEKEILGLDE